MFWGEAEMEGVSSIGAPLYSYVILPMWGLEIHLHLWLHQGECGYHTLAACQPSRYRKSSQNKRGFFKIAAVRSYSFFLSRASERTSGWKAGPARTCPFIGGISRRLYRKGSKFHPQGEEGGRKMGSG